jgi:DNA polymerase-3 subunit alpha
VLGDTYGLMIYQESVMRVAQKFAGYSLAEADNLRKAMGKKSREVMAAARSAFEDGCTRTGYTVTLGKAVRRHREVRRLRLQQEPHLRLRPRHLPDGVPEGALPGRVHGLLAHQREEQPRQGGGLPQRRRANGVKVLTPDINRSITDFAALTIAEVPVDVVLPAGSPGAITFGLSAIRNVGEGLVELLLRERDQNGPYDSFHEFAERVPEPVLNKRTVESLIKAGAFDSLGHPRKGLLMVFEQIIDGTLVRRRERDQGVMSLFGDVGDDAAGGFNERVAIPTLEFDKSDRLKFEKEMLGLYISDHPLLGVEAALRRKVDCSVAEAAEKDDGAMITLGGVITNLSRKFTKKGDQMAVFVLEDLDSAIEVTVFPRVLTEQGHKLIDDAIVTVKGRIDRRDEVRIGFMAQDVQILEGLDTGSAAPLRLRVPATSLTELKIHQIRKILREHPGDSPVYLHIGQGKVLRLADDFCVDLDRVVGELRMALGHDAVVL